ATCTFGTSRPIMIYSRQAAQAANPPMCPHGVVKMRIDTEKEWRMAIDKRFWHKNNNSPPIILTITFTRIAMLGVLESIGLCASPRRQAEVADKGAKIMPFDHEQTMHHFRPLENGGLQTVTVKDPANSTQIALIQAHLKEEAEKFHRGDFSD